MRNGTPSSNGNVSRGMRLLAVVVALLASVSAASGEPWHRDLVILFDEICAAPGSPHAKIAAGENAATAHGWKPDPAIPGRAPFGIGKARWPDDQPFFVVKAWDLSPAPAVDVKMLIKIAGPEFPDVVYTLCALIVPGDAVDALALHVNDAFASRVVAAPRGWDNHWIFPQGTGTKIDDCRKFVTLGSQQPKHDTFLLFGELSFPKSWGPIAHSSFC